jgi:uracil-DNA glycosylase
MDSILLFDPDCKSCNRLNQFLIDVKCKFPAYHARPVSPFGDSNPGLLIVGLAPGMHGANATGRPFTGDYAGILLYEALYEFGYSNQPVSTHLDDGLVLKNCKITNAVKCLPPQNQPAVEEINRCNQFLAAELKQLSEQAIILALGQIAHQAVLKAYGLKASAARFGHNQVHALPEGRLLIDSYHCSRYNVQTKRLTKAMFSDVFQTIAQLSKKR